MKKAIIVSLAICAAGTGFAANVTNLVVGWETWAWNGGGTPHAITDLNPLGSGVATNINLDWNYAGGACNDGTFGSWTGFPANTDTGVGNGWLSDNDSEPAIDFAVQNTSGEALNLNAFHFDAISVGDETAAPTDWTLEVISGDITLGVVTNGTLPNGGGANLPDFDVNLTGLADAELDVDGEVIFRLAFTGGVASTNTYQTLIDNVALTAIVPTPPTLDLLVGWDTWGATKTDDATRLNGASGTATNAGIWGWSYQAASTDGTFGSLSTNIIFASTERGTNSTTHYTGKRNPAGGNGTYTFIVKETAGMDAELAYFHFDLVGRGPKPADDWVLEVMPGSSISTGVVASGTIAQSWTAGFGGNNDAKLLLLADHTLEKGGQVIFNLTFSGGDVTGNLDMDNVAVSKVVPADEAVLVAWEFWPLASLTQLASRENGATGSAKRDDFFSQNKAAGNFDGTFGNFRPSPLADVVITNDIDGFRAISATDTWIDFTVVNTTDVAIAVNSFRFDAMVRGNPNGPYNAPTNWSVEVISGSLTPGVVSSGDIAYGYGDLADYGVLMNGLAYNFLDAGSTNVIRLNFTGGIVSSGQNLDVDNVAITVLTAAAGPVDLSSGIVGYSFNPSGTSTLSFTGGVSSAYFIKSSGNLVFDDFSTIVTPTATPVGTLAGDVITTDASGAATAEFSETADAKFYKIESAP